MCGIWGFVGKTKGVQISDAWDGLNSMTDRGPNDWGMYIGGEGKIVEEERLPNGSHKVVLGNRRLSILDLSTAGNQPMGTEDGLWIIYNGEVYNYRELRQDLREAGYEFTSDTDTEVILRAYEEYGEACVERFRGMFAFVIYDCREEMLFAARDRFGIKPFYYDYRDGRFVFASEVTALLEANVVRPELDPLSVDGFLALGYVPAPRTILRDVRSLRPGSTLTYDVRADVCQTESYWKPTFGESETANAERVRTLLRESVELRLRSDVPVGAFLSGGLDSSTLVALMRDAKDPERGKLHTFSIGFDHETYSETNFAEMVAARFGTVHTSKKITAADIRGELDDIIDAMDQPTINGVNTYFVSRVAAESSLKVALSGLGSDELFFGYPTFDTVPKRYYLVKLLYLIPRPVRRIVATAFDRIGELSSGIPTGKLADAIRSDAPFGAAYLSVRGVFSSTERLRLLGNDHEPKDWAETIECDIMETLSQTGVKDGVSQAEMMWYMHNQLLRDTDAMSMSHSLEVRVPFLDRSLTDYLTDTNSGSRGKGEKGLLKEAMKNLIPLEIIQRQKSGFTFPFENWLRDDLDDVVNYALDDKRLNGTPINKDRCESIRQSVSRGMMHWSRLWALVVLSLWIDRHIVRGKS